MFRRDPNSQFRRFRGRDNGLWNEHNVQPEFEGRIASEIETAELPESWWKFLSL